MTEFQKINKLPMNINLGRLDDGGGIMETLEAHQAAYHKFCYTKCSTEKLKRAHAAHFKTSG